MFVYNGLHPVLACDNGSARVDNEIPGHLFHRMLLQVGEFQLLLRGLRNAGIMMYDHVSSCMNLNHDV